MPLRRTGGSLAVVCLGLTLALPATAVAAPVDPLELTLLSTTDTHGHVMNWDYFAKKEYEGANTLGLSRVASVVDDVRADQVPGDDSVVVVDNGDAIQGTPLTYLYGMGERRGEVLSGATVHPMAQAFNAIGYDAQVVGNHEYNYGLEMLGAYADDLEAPLLGANVLKAGTTEPYHTPYTLVEKVVGGREVTVGVLGLVTPGVRTWDKGHVEGVLEFQDMVAAAKRWVPEVAAKADVVVVLAHTGQGTVPDAGYDAGALHEDVVNNIAVQVPGIDVIVAGHSHQDLPKTMYTNVDGDPVLVTQPNYWARGVTEVTLELEPTEDGGVAVDWSREGGPTVAPHYGSETATPSAALEAELADEHEATTAYVNTQVATSTTELSAATSRYEDTPIIDFINAVQARTVDAALEGTALADVPVLSQASPFSRTAVFRAGPVTIADMASLYIYENTLVGVTLTGAQVKEYLEYSARYFTQVAVGAEFDPETGTNAVVADRPIPDYNYDVLSGVDYTIDVSQPVGSRIAGLSHPDGTPVAATDTFVLAVNNYRQSGGGGFPAVAGAEVVYDERAEIRQLLIDHALSTGVIDPADFAVTNWRLVTEPAVVVPPTPTPAPTAEPTPTAPAPAGPVAGAGTGTGAGDTAGRAAAAGTTPASTAGPRSGSLARTGLEVAALSGLAALLLAGGAGLWLAARRRTVR